MRTRFIIGGLLIIVLIVGVLMLGHGQQSPTPPLVSTATPAPSAKLAPASSNLVLGVQTKTEGCQINGALQDKECTPGAVIPGVTAAQVCTPGYSKSVRNVSNI